MFKTNFIAHIQAGAFQAERIFLIILKYINSPVHHMWIRFKVHAHSSLYPSDECISFLPVKIYL